MNEMKFDWDDLRLFLAVARGGGLAAGAATTDKSGPTLGRRMLMLERSLGCELFVRTARGYKLTSEGEELLAQAVAVESRIYSLAAVKDSKAKTLVKVSAGTWVTHSLCGKIDEIVRNDPIQLRFIAADEVLDIGRREAMIGIRNQRPEGPRLAGRKIARVGFAVYARRPEIETWARVIGTTPSARWVQSQTKEDRVIEVTNPRNALDIALAGQARVVLPTFIGDRIDELHRTTPPIDELSHDQWLVTHHEDRYLPAVRKVIDRIYAILRPGP